MEQIIKGKVWKFGDDVNTDIIYPGRYMNITDPLETARHAFETVYPDFIKEVKKGDIIVAGKYFGCGSSREQAASCLKNLGIGCIVAESFARIYYRNAINLGLPIVIAPGIPAKVNQNDILEVNFTKGIVKNINTGIEIPSIPLPEFVMNILNEGGLIPYTKRRMK